MKSNTLSQRVECFLPGLIAVATVVVASLTTAPVVMPDMDSAEFARIAVQGGIAHPPGYPLFSALLRTWHQLVATNFSDPGLPTSIPALVWLQIGIGGLTTWILWRAVNCSLALGADCGAVANQKQRSENGWIACVATLAVMLAAPAWRSFTGLEPFPLNLLMAASLLCLVTHVRSKPSFLNPDLAIASTGVIFGLAFCNHHSLAFAIPLAWPMLRTRPFKKSLSLAAAGFIFGLAPLLWFPSMLRNPTGFIWGDWTNVSSRLLIHLFRRDYGTFQLMARPEPAINTWATAAWTQKLADLIDGPWFALQSIAASLSWGWLAVAGIGVYAMFSSQAKDERLNKNYLIPRISLYSAASTGLLMALMFNAAATPDTIEIQRRFMALPIILMAPMIALGLRKALNRSQKNNAAWRGTVRAAIGLMLAGHIAAQFSPSNRRPEVLAEQHLRQSLAGIAATHRDSGGDNKANLSSKNKPWIITSSDLDFFAFGWASIEDTAPPLIIQSGLWGNSWYRARILGDITASGLSIPPGARRELASPSGNQSSFQALALLVTLHVQSGGVVYLSAGTFPYLDQILQLESLPIAGLIRVGRPPEAFTGHDGNRNLVRLNSDLIKPLLAGLKLTSGKCKTAWDCHALSGWQRTFVALRQSALTEADNEAAETCTKIVQILQSAAKTRRFNPRF